MQILEPHCYCCILLTAVALGFVLKQQARESPTTTPTPNHILSMGKDRNGRIRGKGHEGQGNMSRRRWTGIDHWDPTVKWQNQNSPWRHTGLHPLDQLLIDVTGTNHKDVSVFFTTRFLFLKTHHLPTKCYFRFLGFWLSSQLDLIYDHLHNNLTNGKFPTTISQQKSYQP